MKTLHYRILLRKEEDGTYTVIVPSLPGCLTFGRSVVEAKAMAKEAVEGFIACLIARGEEVPVEADDEMISSSSKEIISTKIQITLTLKEDIRTAA